MAGLALAATETAVSTGDVAAADETAAALAAATGLAPEVGSKMNTPPAPIVKPVLAGIDAALVSTSVPVETVVPPL